MAEENNDANTDTTDVDDAGSSPDVELQPIKDGNGFTSTTEFEPVEKKAVEKVDTDADTSDETEQKTKTEKSKTKPYHLDPDWQRMKTERDEARQALADRTASEVKQNKPEEKQPIVNILGFEEEELTEMILNDPKRYTSLVARQLASELDQRSEAQKKQASQKYYMQKRDQNLKDFFLKNEDGIPLIQDGSIEKFITENPGYDAISAYYALTGDARTQKTVEAEIKKERDKINRELKAAGKANTVQTTTASKTYNEKSLGKPAKNRADLKAAMVNFVRSRRSA